MTRYECTSGDPPDSTVMLLSQKEYAYIYTNSNGGSRKKVLHDIHHHARSNEANVPEGIDFLILSHLLLFE